MSLAAKRLQETKGIKVRLKEYKFGRIIMSGNSTKIFYTLFHRRKLLFQTIILSLRRTEEIEV